MKPPRNMNPQAMMGQLQQMQQRMQEEIAQIRVEATAGGGMVTVKMDGQKNVLSVKIDPEAAGEVEMLQDTMMAAFNEASKKVDEQTQSKMGGMLGGMGLPPGLF
jgi:DNA-binding YbaB/EbfC family protein